MIEFHEPTIADRAWMQPILYAANLPGADYTFNNMYFWSEYYGEVGLAAGMLTQHKRYRGFDGYIYPAGPGNVRAALEENVCRPLTDCSLRGETPNPCVICNARFAGIALSRPVPLYKLPRLV